MYQVYFWGVSLAVFAAVSVALAASFVVSLLIGIAVAHSTALLLLGSPRPGAIA